VGFWDAYQRSKDATQSVLARHYVGGALQRGDVAGAAQEAFRLGMLGEGQQLQQQAQQQSVLAARANAGSQLAVGQGQQAATGLAATGDFEGANEIRQQVAAMDAQQRAQAAQANEARARVALQIRSMPQEERARVGPQLAQQAGVEVPPDFDWSDTRLDGFINSARSIDQILKTQEPYTLGANDRRYNGQNQLVAQGYEKPDFLVVPQGGSAVPLNDAARAAGGVSPNAPQPGSPVGAGVSAMVANPSGAARGERNNNPGNIEDGPFARSLPGYAGSDGRFARFATPEQGIAANTRLLSSYIQRGYNTPAEIVGRWAPQSENGASTGNYAAYVAQRLGIGVNDPVPPERVPELRNAMFEFENGRRPGAGQAQAGQIPGTIQGPPKPGYRFATREEKVAQGLNPELPYQISPDNQFALVPQGDTANRGVRRDTVQLRKEFDALPDVRDFREVAANYNQVRSLARSGASASDDVALIFSYMKMLDPGSVVREGEFATAQNTTGVPSQVLNAYNRAMRGNRLNDEQRTQFASTAQTIFDRRRTRYDQVAEQYRGYAAESDLNPNSIAPPYVPLRDTGRGDRTRGERQWSAQQQAAVRSGWNVNGATVRLDPNAERGKPSNPYLIDPARPDQSYQALPKGANYLSPDGHLRVKR